MSDPNTMPTLDEAIQQALAFADDQKKRAVLRLLRRKDNPRDATIIRELSEENERLRKENYRCYEILRNAREQDKKAWKEKAELRNKLKILIRLNPGSVPDGFIDPELEAEMRLYDAVFFPDAYVVLDLETTGYSPSSAKIIEIAAVKYKNDLECDSFVTLVNPGVRIPAAVMALTGIRDEDVTNAPSILEILPALSAFLEDYPIVAHNADFDMGFLAEVFELAGIDFFNRSIDTLELARERIVGMKSYSLESLKRLLKLDNQPSHRALPDVYTTAALYRACKRGGVIVPPELRGEVHKKTDYFKQKFRNCKPSDIQCTADDIDPYSPLYKRAIVFTGELSIDRGEAMQMAVNVGAIVRSSVSSKTDYLVVGKQDIALVGDDGMSTKEEKAHALNDAGKADIKFINEAEFLRLAQRKELENERTSQHV